jgi:hypothetical protein
MLPASDCALERDEMNPGCEQINALRAPGPAKIGNGYPRRVNMHTCASQFSTFRTSIAI